MSPRKRPCQYCKKRRRKCEKPFSDEPCKLCQQKGMECEPIAPSYSYYYDDQTSHRQNYKELIQLMQELGDLEEELKALKESGQQNTQWQLQLRNGRLELLSKINSLEEFKLYGKAAIAYLSPFKGVFNLDCSVPQSSSTSFVQLAFYQLLQNQHGHSSSHRVISTKLDKLPRACRNPRQMVFPLIDHYFKCYNTVVPILHEASFRGHLELLSDPFGDPVVNAICASTCVFHCKHIFLSPLERRYLGEYFFQQSIDLLLDTFDIPSRALDTLLTINLLLTFMLTTLRIPENKKWITIGTAIAIALLKEQKTADTYQERVRQAVIHRNRILIFIWAHTSDYYSEGKHMAIPAFNLEFDILPDDNSRTKDTLEVINCVCQFLFHPLFTRVYNHVRAMAVGKATKIKLEDMMRYEEAIQLWWQKLPSHMKLGDTPNSFTQEMIKGCTSVPKLTVAVVLLSTMMSIETALLNSIQLSQQDGELRQHQSFFCQRSLKSVLYIIDASILIIKQLDKLCCYSLMRLLVNMIDCIASLLSHDVVAGSEKLRPKMKELMVEFSKHIQPDHRVPRTDSPYSILSLVPPAEDKIPSLAELYQSYPLPIEALLFDILQTTVHKFNI